MNDKKLEQAMARQKYTAATLAEDCIKAIYDSIEKPRDIELPGGIKAHLKTFYAPKVRDDGTWTFGIDIILEGLSIDHMEFCMEHTGQGGMIEDD